MTFSSLPAEIHVGIARYCENHDLINLCRVSKLLNQQCLHVLYRHVDLQCGRRDGLTSRHHRLYDHSVGTETDTDRERVGEMELKRLRHNERHRLLEKQLGFCEILRIYPEHGSYVRLLEYTFVNLRLPMIEEAWGLAMRSLTHVQHVDLEFYFVTDFPTKAFSTRLFQSVTSMRLVGQIQFSLAKSILNGTNPATLKHLCLDLVPDLRIGGPPPRSIPRDRGENAQVIAAAVAQGLLTPLTGRFTALQTLIMRRIAGYGVTVSWHAAAEEASYDEWASFIHSVRGTLKMFVFEQVVDWHYSSPSRRLPICFQTMDERFQRLVLPTIASGTWPCLELMELRGVRMSSDQGELEEVLRTILGENTTIVVKEQPDSVQNYRKPYFWNW